MMLVGNLDIGVHMFVMPFEECFLAGFETDVEKSPYKTPTSFAEVLVNNDHANVGQFDAKAGGAISGSASTPLVSFANILNSEEVTKKNYVNNTWGKFGLQKVIRNDDGVFLFKFASLTGVEQVLGRGPWMIREVTKVPIWVKLHGVLLLAYLADGLSLITTQIVRSDSKLKKEVIMAILNEKGNWYTKEVIRVEYEWKPPHCIEYKSSDGFTEVKRMKNKGKKADQQPRRTNEEFESDDEVDEVIFPEGLCFIHKLYAFENKHTRLARGGNANTDNIPAASLCSGYYS
nr:hypothetical protein [Tanacetum cinerariifolium]